MVRPASQVLHADWQCLIRHQDLEREYIGPFGYVTDKQHFGLLYPGGSFHFTQASADSQLWTTVKRRYVLSWKWLMSVA
jgi:hypothetical protein